MHERLRLLEEVRPLRDPVLIAAITGWTDTSGAAVLAVDHLARHWHATPLADIDPEPFYDFTVQRPRTRLEGDGRVLDWPRNRFYAASPEGAGREFLLLSGIEPHMRWRVFTDIVTEMMEAVGASTSITLGVQPGPVPHTRPLPVNLSASDDGFEQQFGLKIPTSRYEGPTGIISVLNLHFREREWRNASLWAVVPHYLNVGPNPNAAISLVKAVDKGFHTSTPHADLEERSEEFARQVQEAMEQSDEAASYIRSLEEQYDANASVQPDQGELPTSDELLGDLEQFLRQQREDR
jgi:predicted ATP-grasp superfamily ATP-dependent carboligase